SWSCRRLSSMSEALMYRCKVLFETFHGGSCCDAKRRKSARLAPWMRSCKTASIRSSSGVFSDLMFANPLSKPCVVEPMQALVPRHCYLFLISRRSQVRTSFQRVRSPVYQGEGDHLTVGPGRGHALPPVVAQFLEGKGEDLPVMFLLEITGKQVEGL